MQNLMTGAIKPDEKEDKMKKKSLLIICCILIVAGCVTTKPVTVSSTPVNPCPLPSGYQLEAAIEMAEKTLTSCPEKLDRVFMALLDIAKHSPDKGNGLIIQDMLKNLIRKNKVSETYTKTLYQKYFSREFVTISETKVYNLSGEMDSIKKALRQELALKRIGMVECSNDKESYKTAEAEYARAIGFMDNLVYNEEYIKGIR